MNDQEPYEPDIDQMAKQALQDEKERLAALELPIVKVRGTTYTKCPKHGLRANAERFCTICDYHRNPNCEVCSQPKDDPFSAGSEKYEDVDLHKECRRVGDGFWMTKKTSQEV